MCQLPALLFSLFLLSSLVGRLPSPLKLEFFGQRLRGSGSNANAAELRHGMGQQA